MNELSGDAIFATICNTVGEASPYALWFTINGRQYVADLSDHVVGTSGLTGIAFQDGRLYLAVQSPEARILVLDLTLQVVDTIRHDGFNDLHSLRTAGPFLLIVSSRTGAVFRRDGRSGEITAWVRFDPRAWVCDVLSLPDDLWLCCHNLSFLDPEASGGGIFSVSQRKAILSGMSGPHSLIRWRDQFLVLDSANEDALFFSPGGAQRTVRLQGFLRGAAALDVNTLLIAGGPDRTISRKNPEGDGQRGLRQVLQEHLRMFEVRQDAPARVMLPEMPGFELYDLLPLPASAGVRPAHERMIPADPGLFARFYYTSLVTAHVRLAGTKT